MAINVTFLSDFDDEFYTDFRQEMNLYIRFFVSVNSVNEIYFKYGNDFVMRQIDDLRKVVFSYYLSDFERFCVNYPCVKLEIIKCRQTCPA